MGGKKMFFGGGIRSQFSFPILAYIKSWDGANLDSSGKVSSLTDLTGNGHDFIPSGTTNPELVPIGINGVPSIRFNGYNGLQNLDQLIEEFNYPAYWIVFKLEATSGVSYHAINMISATITNPSSYAQIYNSGTSSNNFHLRDNSSTDLSITTGSQLANNYLIAKHEENEKYFSLNGGVYVSKVTTKLPKGNVFIGKWNTGGAKMLFCEFGIIKNSIDFGLSEKAELEAYLLDKYNI